MNTASPFTPNLVRRIGFASAAPRALAELWRKQWLLTAGLGGYASGTISGAVTWRYHGLLIAALPAPFGRMVMLNHLAEAIHLPDGRVLTIGGAESSEPEDSANSSNYLTEFRLEN